MPAHLDNPRTPAWSRFLIESDPTPVCVNHDAPTKRSQGRREAASMRGLLMLLMQHEAWLSYVVSPP